ncbi:MAG: universal stress protein [Gammaproteobacteria bacterium]|nr:universal stress protein [Gammaproteobacteria bacterium]
MFKRIILPQDLEVRGEAEAACVRLVLERADPEQSEIHLVTVIPDFGMPLVASFFPQETLHRAEDEVKKRLWHLTRTLFPGWSHLHSHVRVGKPSREIVALARIIHSDLIVMPPHSGSSGQELIGSCTTRVVHNAHCSVLVVR